MSKRVIVLFPFLGAFLLLLFGYLSLMPAAQLFAATQATTWQVDLLTDPNFPDGTACTVAADDCSLRGAIDKAADGDTIEIVVTGAIILHDPLILAKNLTIMSASAANHRINGDAAVVIFSIAANKTIVLSGLTLEDGFNSTDSGGAVSMASGTLTMTDVVLQNNIAFDKGGALSIEPNSGNANVFLSNVTFLNNHALDDFESGGAIYAASDDNITLNLTIVDGHFENNIGGVVSESGVDGDGGAIAASTLDNASNLTLEIRNTDFISNGSGSGGAIYLQPYARIGVTTSLQGVIVDSEFVSNQGEKGAAIYFESLDGGSEGTLTISNTTFLSNTATEDGGALYQETLNRGESPSMWTIVTIHNSTFSNNQAPNGEGGAIFVTNFSREGSGDTLASLELVNVTMSGNRAKSDGAGAIYAEASGITDTTTLVTATHVTIVNNAAVDGSNIGLSAGSFAENYFSLKNSIVAGKDGLSCISSNTTIQGANNLIKGTSCGNGNSFRLGRVLGLNRTLADNGGPTLTHSLFAGSNALNAVPAGQCTVGNTAIAVTVDQRGETRPFGAACDIGAFEAQAAPLPTQDAIVGLTASNDGPTLVNEPTLLTASITSGDDPDFTWDFGDGNSGEGITTTHTYTQVGIYTATVVAANATNSLTTTTTVYVGDAVVEVRSNFYDPNAVAIEPGETVIWVLEQGNHSVTADDGSFEQPAGTNWPPFVQSFDSPGTFAYHCSVHGLSMAGQVVVGDGTSPITGLTASNDSPTDLGEPTAFNAEVTGGVPTSYSWDFGDGNIGTGKSPSHTYATVGSYTASVTAQNSAGSMTATTRVTIVDPSLPPVPDGLRLPSILRPEE